jgi:ferredoxin-NADP reductase
MRYKTVILVSGGVGVTPCVAALRHIYHIKREEQADTALQSVFFVWSCKDLHDFEWYHEVLELANAKATHGSGYPRLYVSRISFAEVCL